MNAATHNVDARSHFTYNLSDASLSLTLSPLLSSLVGLMPEYREIYNHVVSTDQRYNLAENSPGLRAVIQATDQLSMLSGRSLDVGCGVGFVVEYLSGRTFDMETHGVDISNLAIDRAKQRLQNVPGSEQRLHVLSSQSLPFDDDFFSLVTCFDVLEHLDSGDIQKTLEEIWRVLRPGGIFYGSVSCRTSGVVDNWGDNLHRTVESPDWWIDVVNPDRAEYDGHRVQLSLWKHLPRNSGKKKGNVNVEMSNSGEQPANAPSVDKDPQHASVDTSELYQRIYDENPWYGDASQGRCPGVRLLPQYSEWLTGPVLDLGCGRGQTVEHLQQLGFEAEGIDQIKNHPDMRVGDITQPIPDIAKFKSVVCIDCIEHLLDDQVLGLFANMKQVARQAFSIHIGESTGTGQELHVNRKSFSQWTELIREHFEIAHEIEINAQQILYLTRTKV